MVPANYNAPCARSLQSPQVGSTQTRRDLSIFCENQDPFTVSACLCRSVDGKEARQDEPEATTKAIGLDFPAVDRSRGKSGAEKARTQGCQRRAPSEEDQKPEENGQIMAYLNMKLAPGKIAKLVGCTSMTVIRKRNRLKETGEIKRKPGSGRPQTLSDREQRNICTQSRRDTFTTAVQIHRSLTGMNGRARCSVRTVRIHSR